MTQRPTLRSASCGMAGFSLPEVLLAMFILAIGIISIGTLFPAGIAQQRQSTDDVNGAIVANSALAVIRSKLKPELFGTFEEFGYAYRVNSQTGRCEIDPNINPAVILPPLPASTWPLLVSGDWPWMRPGFVFADDSSTTNVDERGMIDVFSHLRAISSSLPMAWEPYTGPVPNERLFGIPHNILRNGAMVCSGGPPAVTFSQFERFYPMGSGRTSAENPAVRPQYVWECMFRRFQGRIQVAIFVFRVTNAGDTPAVVSALGPNRAYVASPNQSFPSFPPLPVKLNVNNWDLYGADGQEGFFNGANDDAIIPNTTGTYNPSNQAESWQATGQWLLDQNGNVHRVLNGRNRSSDGPVELSRPISPLQHNGIGYPSSHFFGTSGTYGVDDVVTNIWYIPTIFQADFDLDGNTETTLTLRPVYVMVSDL